MAETANQAKPMKKAFWASTISSLFLGPVLLLLCLRQWGTDHPWSRLNLYSGGFLFLAMVAALEQAATFIRSALRSKEAAREALGLSYDPTLLRWGTPLNAVELAVVLDYAHWHLVPALERSLLQSIGLALGILGVIWLTWTDSWLGRHFATDRATRTLMTGGPFRFVRHPRYAAVLVAKLAVPLLFASVIGWAVLPLWAILILRRISREEAHMTELFGAEYQTYTRRTARLLPGIF